MNCNRAFNQRTINYVLSLALLISISQASLAQEDTLPPVPFINNLNNYFQNYYSQNKKEEIIRPVQQVLKDIEEIASRYCKIDKEQIFNQDNFDSLSKILDAYLKDYVKSVNIFTISNSDIVNCWLGDLLEEKKETKNVWGKEVGFVVKAIDNLKIQDFTYYSSAGREALDVGTRDGIIYYNLESYRIRADNIWDFFTARTTKEKNRRYTPSKSNRLRKKLYYKTWLDLYKDCVKNNSDAEKAHSVFIDKAMVLLKENSLFHEIGHIFADRYLKSGDEAKEETIAFLTELRYGPLPYESLDALVSSRWHNSLAVHKLASDRILYAFISYIKFQQRKGNNDYKRIMLPSIKPERKIDALYELTPDQIRNISESILINNEY